MESYRDFARHPSSARLDYIAAIQSHPLYQPAAHAENPSGPTIDFRQRAYVRVVRRPVQVSI